MNIKNKILEEIFDYFIKSNDFNGIVVSKLAEKINLDYQLLINELIELVKNDEISIQNGENPHIIRFAHHITEKQLGLLEEARANQRTELNRINLQSMGSDVSDLVFFSETHTLCVYPSIKYLNKNYKTSTYDNLPFTKLLAYGEPQLKPLFFALEVLERYFTDPRYQFEFEDYCGRISYHETQEIPSELAQSDQVFLKTFGLGYDGNGNRVVVAYLRYLSDLSMEHQVHWNSKLIMSGCKIVNEYYTNTIQGEWVFSQSVFSAFIEEQRLINEMSFLVLGKRLFKATFEGDKRPKEFTFFLTPTLLNFESFIILLDKMISENINKDFFKGQIEDFEMISIDKGLVERRPKGTLKLLDEWLRDNFKLKNPDGYIKLMKPFREIRKERQKPAHKISENRYDKSYSEKQMDIINEAYLSLVNLRYIFQQHPKSSSVEIPEWISNMNIKNF